MADPITTTPPASPAGEAPAADQTNEDIKFGDASSLIQVDNEPEEAPKTPEPAKTGFQENTKEAKQASRQLRRMIKVDNSAIHDTDEGFLDKVNPFPEMKQKREVRNTVVKELVTSAPAGSTRDEIVVQGKQKLAAKVEAAGSDAGHLAVGAKEYVTVQDVKGGRYMLKDMDNQADMAATPPPAGETASAGEAETAEGTAPAEEAALTVHDHPIPKSTEFPRESAIDDPVNKGKKFPYFTDDPYSGQVMIPEGIPADEREQAARSAAYYTGQGMGLDSRQAAIYAEDVLRNNDNDPDDALIKINADLANSYRSQSSRTGGKDPVEAYRNPKDYAVSRAFDEDAPEEEVAEFRKNLGEQLKGMGTDGEKWEAVHHPDLKDGEEYKNAVLSGGTAAADGEFTRSNNIGYDNNVYDDPTQEDKALEVANAINDKARKEYEEVKTARGEGAEETKKAYEKYQKTRGEAARALKENPKQLERMSKKEFPDDTESQFVSSKGANARAKEARKEAKSRVVDKMGQVKADIDTVSGAVKTPFETVTGVAGAVTDVASLGKKWGEAVENDKLTGMLDEAIKQNADLTKNARRKEAPIEFVKKSEDYGTPKDKKTANREALEAGNQAGTVSTPGSMLAPKTATEQGQGQSGEKKDKRTSDLENLADQVRAQRAINRYT